MALTPCGTPLTPSCYEPSTTTPTFNFFLTGNPLPSYYPTLELNTTYYVSVRTSAPGPMFAQLQHH